jgi:hypothetical protein
LTAQQDVEAILVVVNVHHHHPCPLKQEIPLD